MKISFIKLTNDIWLFYPVFYDEHNDYDSHLACHLLNGD